MSTHVGKWLEPKQGCQHRQAPKSRELPHAFKGKLVPCFCVYLVKEWSAFVLSSLSLRLSLRFQRRRISTRNQISAAMNWMVLSGDFYLKVHCSLENIASGWCFLFSFFVCFCFLREDLTNNFPRMPSSI